MYQADRAQERTRYVAVIDKIRQLVTPILTDLALDLYDLEYAGGTVRVTVDKPGGVDLEDIALATRLISREFDHVDPITGRYTLEVSSPGLERNLRTPDHFSRVIGWKVNVRTHPTVEGDRRAIGTLVAADDSGITVLGEKAERTLNYSDIERAKTVFEWTPTPAPSSKVQAKKKPSVKAPTATTAGQTPGKPGARPARKSATTEESVTS
jgi:ribosome maturation factor RimP